MGERAFFDSPSAQGQRSHHRRVKEVCTQQSEASYEPFVSTDQPIAEEPGARSGCSSLVAATDRFAVWGDLWGIADLAERVTVSVSHRMRRSLGRCVPAQGAIRLSAAVLDAPPQVLAEVLCHEAAHIAIHVLHGAACQPHGSEWAALLRTAGFEPRTGLPFEHRDDPFQLQSRSDLTYEHRCPVCQSLRLAKRPVRRWRCADCVAAGLDGRLEIARTGRH
jgi:predicted SprT family Zn-dependent metalloprotease